MATRGRKPSKDRNYFSEREESAVAEYIESTDDVRRNEIYNTILHTAFVKMIESIIRRYKLYVPDEDFAQTFNDTISYLLMKIHNFKPDKGKKAYSYCGTVCKNYLMFKCIQYAKEQQRSTSFDEHVEELSNIRTYNISDDDNSQIASKMIKNMSIEIKKMIDDPKEYSLNENEIKVGLALIELLDNWEDILTFDDASNKLRKSTVLYFLREETMMETKEVRDNMKKYKCVYGIIKDSLINS